jgi:hypothetical protein
MSSLERHGVGLLGPIERLDVPDLRLCLPEREQKTIRGNFRGVMAIYFRLANASQHDTRPFLHRLDEELLRLALSGVQQVWLNDFGDNHICLTLYTYFIHRLGSKHPTCSRLKRLIRCGQITFDPTKPGVPPHSTESKTAEARKVL